jgi:hypothetical protein
MCLSFAQNPWYDLFQIVPTLGLILSFTSAGFKKLLGGYRVYFSGFRDVFDGGLCVCSRPFKIVIDLGGRPCSWLPQLQGQRTNKFVLLRTLDEIRVLADKELVNIAKRAQSIRDGLAGKAEAGGVKRKGSPLDSSSKKRGRGVLDMPGDEDIEGGKKSVLHMPYML